MRMVQGASHSVTDDQALAQWPPVVCAVGADRKKFAADACDQHLLVTNMAHELATLGDIGKRHTFDKVGSLRRFLWCGHSLLRSR